MIGIVSLFIMHFGFRSDYFFSFLQEFQKDVVKAAEAFTAVGYKHIEAGLCI